MNLLQFIAAVAVLFQHLVQAPNLTFDAAKPLQDRLALLWRPTQVQTAFDEYVIHVFVILPRGI